MLRLLGTTALVSCLEWVFSLLSSAILEDGSVGLGAGADLFKMGYAIFKTGCFGNLVELEGCCRENRVTV